MSTATRILAMPALQDGGSITAPQVAEALGISEKQAIDELRQVVFRGALYRWPGIANSPATYHKPAPAKTLQREKCAR